MYYLGGGLYSCYTCRMYVVCAGKYLVLRPCPPGLVWDDDKKLCRRTSSTCDPNDVTRFTTPATTTEEYVTSSGDGDRAFPDFW